MVASPTMKRLGGEQEPLIEDLKFGLLESESEGTRAENRGQTVTDTRTSVRRVVDKAQTQPEYEEVNEEFERPVDEVLRGIKIRIAKALSPDNPKDCQFFYMDALPVIRGMVNELMRKGWVPSIRHSIFDRFGTPLHPFNEMSESKELAPGGKIVALERMPRNLVPSSFRDSMAPGEVHAASETDEGLGFGPKFSRTSHVAFASCDVADADPVSGQPIIKSNGKNWDRHATLPNVNYECSSLEGVKQYGTGLFEGMGVEKNEEGEVVVFRLRDHWKRMNEGGLKLGMPEIPFEIFEAMVQEVIQANWDYIPEAGKGRMYLRPNWFDHGESLKVGNSGRFALIISAIPIGSAESYFHPGRKKFFLAKGKARVAEGGTNGMLKLDGNYTTTINLIQKANEKGMAGVIFTNAAGDRVEETNASSVIFIQKSPDGKHRIITPSLKHGTILDSMTRKTILELAKEREWIIEERDISPRELQRLAKTAQQDPTRGLEAIAVGTAAVIAPIHEIQVGTVNRKTNNINENGPLIQISARTEQPENEGRGEVSQIIFEALSKIKSGKAQKEMREELEPMRSSNPKRDKLRKRLKEAESYLTIVEPPKSKIAA